VTKKELEKKLAGARETLTFYADEWDTDATIFQSAEKHWEPSSELLADQGKRAEQALKDIE